MWRSNRAGRFVGIFVALVSLTGTTKSAAQDSLTILVRRLDSAEVAKDFVRARMLADAGYAISEGKPDFLVVGALNAARADDADGVIDRFRRAVESGFMQAEAAARDSAFASLRLDKRWTQLLNDARRRSQGIDTTLRTELLDLERRDQENRKGFDVVMNQFGRRSREADSAVAALEKADTPLQRRLREIVAARGWPMRSMVGDDAAHAAWLILQHMPAADQRKLLPLVRSAADRGEARPGDAALLEDRVLVADGKPQRFGSQLRWSDSAGSPTLYPIADEACVDRRRATALLLPLAAYVKIFGAEYEGPRGTCAALPPGGG